MIVDWVRQVNLEKSIFKFTYAVTQEKPLKRDLNIFDRIKIAVKESYLTSYSDSFVSLRVGGVGLIFSKTVSNYEKQIFSLVYIFI